MKITRISATGLDNYVSCPYRYYLRYVKNYNKHVSPTQHMLFGIMIHKILEDFHKYLINSKLPEDHLALAKDLYAKIHQLTMVNIANSRSQNPNMLTKIGFNDEEIFKSYIYPYYDYFITNQFYTRRIETEKTFDTTIGELAQVFPKDQLHPQYTTFKDVVITGKIDLIIYPNLIIDFKTQSSPSAIRELRKSFQTQIYTILFDKDMIFQYIYLHNKLIVRTLEIKQSERLNTLNNLIDLIYKLETTTKFNRNPKACYNCLFKKFCWG